MPSTTRLVRLKCRGLDPVVLAMVSGCVRVVHYTQHGERVCHHTTPRVWYRERVRVVHHTQGLDGAAWGAPCLSVLLARAL
eukprot:2465137-Prymnesium_polylepis.1